MKITFQPLIEKTETFSIGEKIKIDDMEFYLRKIEVQWEEDYHDFSLILWGKEPNATTIHHSRIIKIGEYVWRPNKVNCSFQTLEDKIFYNDGLKLEELKSFMENQFSVRYDEIVSCSFEISTMINDARGYYFDQD